MSKFTDGELDVMRVLWEHGELKPADIIARFPRPIKNPAMRSFLSVLVQKGHIVRRKMGKAYFYQAKTPQEPALRDMLQKIVEVFFRGSTEALLCRLIRSEKLTKSQLLELKEIAQQEKTRPKTSQKERRAK